MKKTISLILIAAMTALTGLSAATNNKSKGKEKQKEVAKELGITPQAVSKDYKKARKKIIELRDYLNETFPEDEE